MTFTFNNAIPQAGDFLDESQGDLLNNNIALNGIFARNHVPLINVSNGQGRHTYIEMVNNSGIPSPSGGLQDESGTLYTKRGSSVADMYYSNDNTGNQYMLTNVVKLTNQDRFKYFGKNLDLKLAPVSGKGFGGWTFLPGGLIMQYGVVEDTEFDTNDICVVIYPLPLADKPFCSEVSARSGSGLSSTFAVSSNGGTATTISIYKRSSGSGAGISAVYWQVIGPY